MIEVRGLAKHYGARAAVKGVDLEVLPGQILGLLGPNGAGKTTTISVIAGVFPPTHGQVIIAGHDVVKDGRRARSQLGYVPQELALYDELSAVENLAFFASVQGVPRSLRAARVQEALALCGLAERAHDRVFTFSGGMKRRLNIAAALLHAPKAVILDEPTVGVDPQSRAHIFDQVRRLRDERQLAVLYTSHYMEEVQALCDQVAILDGGSLVAKGTPEGLVRAHAGDAFVDLTVEGEPRALEGALSPFGAVRRRDRTYRIETGAVAAVVAAVERAGGRVRTLHAGARDLESVFLSLTGHELRD